MRTDLAHLVGGLVLALAGCALALSHVVIPSFVPFASLTLLGVGAGLALPGVASKSTLPSVGNPPNQATAQVTPGKNEAPAVVPLPPAPPPAASGSAAAG